MPGGAAAGATPSRDRMAPQEPKAMMSFLQLSLHWCSSIPSRSIQLEGVVSLSTFAARWESLISSEGDSGSGFEFLGVTGGRGDSSTFSTT